eukprot:TRINITY_DN2937_c0_g3_i1.p1 TRINITY_DN2937_c0_g3~~TRINITY_DN2937_c0_g3_i1.p1  ORF type:complete len:117 (-),score=25.23 TRINITY_DN2937_c0_g3_i1:24-374(-)
MSLLHDYSIPLTEKEAENLFAVLDLQGKGYILHDDLLMALIGKMNEERKKLVVTIFNFLDLEESGKLTIWFLKSKYTPEKAPEVIRRVRTAEDVMKEFEETIYQFYYEFVPINGSP